MSKDLKIFISIRYDPQLLQCHQNPQYKNAITNYDQPCPYYMLLFHSHRIMKAISYLDWKKPYHDLGKDLNNESILAALDKAVYETGETDKPWGLRLTIGPTGIEKCEPRAVSPVQREFLYPQTLRTPSIILPDSPCFTVYLDTVWTPISPFTHFKTTNRQVYDDARTRHHIQGNQEVLLFNDNNEVMEGSFTTPYFYRNESWVTPRIEEPYQEAENGGGQPGTTRRWALATGLAVEQIITRDALKHGEYIWLSNGIRGFFLGKISIF